MRGSVEDQLRRRHGDSLEVEWVGGAAGESLLVYSYETASACRIARARWSGRGGFIEYELTKELPQPGQPPARTCTTDVTADLEDALGIGERLFVVRHGYGLPSSDPEFPKYEVAALLVIDPADGDVVLQLDLEAFERGEPFTAGTKSKLEHAPDGTLTIWTLDYDEAARESCSATGGEDCEPKYELESRYTWDPNTRELVQRE